VPEKLKKVKKVRNILLIGRTGAGKSSLANLLVDNEGLFRIGTGSVSVTKDYQTELFEDKEAGITYRIIDTIGLGDTKSNEEKVLSKLGKITERLENGLHQVLFVISGRFTRDEVAVFESLKVVFGDEVVNHCTIVRNNFPKFRNLVQGEEDVESLVDEEGKIREVLEKIRGEIVYLDNPPLIDDEEDYQNAIQKIRRVARERLLVHLRTKRYPYQVTLSATELDRRIRAYVDPLEREIREAQAELEQKQRYLNESRPNNERISD